MELKNLLQYQKQDAELIKLENQLNNNKNKKAYVQMAGIAKDAQAKSNQLEKQAGELLQTYEQLKKTYETNIKSANIVGNKKLDDASLGDLETIEEIAKNIINNLNILEKKLLAEAERVNVVLNSFKQTKDQYNMAKEKYTEHKQLFDDDDKKLQPAILEQTKILKKLEADIDPALLAKYKQRRLDKIFPVLVPCLDKACGGCRMELPSANLATLKSKGVLECEDCHRIIYLAD